MEISEMKNWCMSMCKPEGDGLMSKPSDEAIKEDGLLSKKQYLGIAFGVLSLSAIIFFLVGFSILIADAFEPKGLINTMSAIMILIGLGTYVYAIKFKPDSRYWGEVGTYALVLFFTAGFMGLGLSMEWFKEPKTGIFILLFLYIPVLYLRKNLLGGIVYAGLLIAYADEGLLGGSLSQLGLRGMRGLLGGEATSFWFWFFFAAFIPYFTLSFKENFKPGISSIVLGYYFAFLLLFGITTALGSHQTMGVLLGASLLYLIGKIVYKHNYILFRPFQVISVIIFIAAAVSLSTEGGTMTMYAGSGYLSFVSSILKEWTAYIALLVILVAGFMVFMIWKSEYVDNNRKANVFAVVLPFYFLLMAPLVNWGAGEFVVYLNCIVVIALSAMVTLYSIEENKWYNLLWAPFLGIFSLISIVNNLALGSKVNAIIMIISAGILGMIVFKFISKIGESLMPEEGEGNDNGSVVDTPTPAPVQSAPTPEPAPAPAPEPTPEEAPSSDEDKAPEA